MSMEMPPQTCNNQSTMYMSVMHTSFFWGKDVVVLFPGWPGSDRLGMYVLALAAVFVLALVGELFSSAPPERQPYVQPTAVVVTAGYAAASYAVHMMLAYFVMLSVMSYNVGVFIAAVAGHAVGRFIAAYLVLSASARPPEDEEY